MVAGTHTAFGVNTQHALGATISCFSRSRRSSRRNEEVEARSRPPRKVFLSAKGKRELKLQFLTEPKWVEDEDKREVLQADCINLETEEKVVLEQFCPDAFDLSEALVKGLGTIVVGKSAAIVARGAVRKTNDGRSVEYLDGFEVSRIA